MEGERHFTVKRTDREERSQFPPLTLVLSGTGGGAGAGVGRGVGLELVGLGKGKRVEVIQGGDRRVSERAELAFPFLVSMGSDAGAGNYRGDVTTMNTLPPPQCCCPDCLPASTAQNYFFFSFFLEGGMRRGVSLLLLVFLDSCKC